SVARKKIPIPKRLQFSTNDNDDDAREGQHMDLQPLLNHVKQIDANVLKLLKQQQQATLSLDRQENFLKILCNNQKKTCEKFKKI
ncbi:unnamed protein product, partial [Rotaria socialis]